MIQKSITIDLWRKYRESIEFNQHEVKGRTLNITLTSGGSPVNLTGAAVTFNMNKGAEVIYNACVITSAAQGKVSLLIEGAVCDTAGVFESFVEIVKTDDVLRTHNFSVMVKTSTDNTEAVEAQSEFTALQQALALVSGHEARILQNKNDISAITASLAALIAKPGTLLWGTGSWSSGNITVSGINNFRLVQIYRAGTTIPIVAAVTPNANIRGGLPVASDGVQNVSSFHCVLSGETLTWGYCFDMGHAASGPHGAVINYVVSAIIGLL